MNSGRTGQAIVSGRAGAGLCGGLLLLRAIPSTPLILRCERSEPRRRSPGIARPAGGLLRGLRCAPAPQDEGVGWRFLLVETERPILPSRAATRLLTAPSRTASALPVAEPAQRVEGAGIL